jgi:hypothetical protein
VAPGPCVASSDANFQYNCISTEAGIPSKYDSFSSPESGKVQVVGNGTPSVQTGGQCTGGFNTSTGQFVVDTTFGNDAIAYTGADISEVVVTPAFLAAVGVQNTITSMSALVVGDSSNTDHYIVIVFANTSSGPLTFATAGTVSLSNGTPNIAMTECMEVASSPPPPPPPTSLNCPARNGSGSNGLSFAFTSQGQTKLAYQISTTSANQPNTTTLTWGASYQDQSLASSSYTGSLRVSLWAVPYDFQGSGTINGTRIATASPSFTGSGAKSTNQLFNFSTAVNISSTVAGNNPPAGAYCLVMALEQYDATTACTEQDHFCYVDYAQFSSAQTFQ